MGSKTTYPRQPAEPRAAFPRAASLPRRARGPALFVDRGELQRGGSQAEDTWSNTVTLITITDTAGRGVINSAE